MVVSRWFHATENFSEVYVLNAAGDRVDAVVDPGTPYWLIDTTSDFGPVALYNHHPGGVDVIPLAPPIVDGSRIIIIIRPVVLG